MKDRSTTMLTGVLVLFALLFTGCGGGTMGTGIVPASFGMKAHGTDISFVLVATVVDSKGRAIPDAIVTVVGAGGTVSRKADRVGLARLPIMMRSGEFLDVSVWVGSERYQSSQQISPAGAREVEQTLLVERSGGITFK